jgi:retron-type reverse transcriptase
MYLFRIPQMVIKQLLEPQVETIFDQDSHGYRPDTLALQAVEVISGRKTLQPTGCRPHRPGLRAPVVIR